MVNFIFFCDLGVVSFIFFYDCQLTIAKKSEINDPQTAKKMILTIGSRFRRRVEGGSKFGFPGLEFCAEFGYRVGWLVGWFWTYERKAHCHEIFSLKRSRSA